MTQYRKCETCRARKVKCDETRPTCGNCAKKNRNCRYRFELIAFVKEGSRKRMGQTSSGLALCKPLQAPAVPSPMPQSVASKRGTQWAAMIGRQPLHENPILMFGTWVSDIPSRIGANSTVDLAVSYAIDSHQAALIKTDEAFHTARLSGHQAVQGLRLAIDSQRNVDLDLLLAMKLMYISEVLICTGTLIWVLHSQKMFQLWKLHGPPKPDQCTEWSLYRSVFLDEPLEAVFMGSDSAFDSPSWFESMKAVFGDASTEPTTSFHLMRNLARLPRLIRLIRAVPDDSTVIEEVMELVQTLTQDCCETEILQAIHENARCVPTTSDHAWVVPYSWHFNSYNVFELVIFHSAYQLLLCGAVDHLCHIVPAAAASVDLDAIHESDVQASLSIAMCLEYANYLDEQQALPYARLRLLALLQICCGPWYRMRKRLIADGTKAEHSEISESAAYQRATEVEQWLINISNEMSIQWRTRPKEQWQLEPILDVIAGGPLTDATKLRRSPKAILASQEQILADLRAYNIHQAQ